MESEDVVELCRDAPQCAAPGETATSTLTMRVIYFRGHRDVQRSALITQLCRDYETISQLHRGECATRTLSNLYNLHAVRGVVESERLLFRTSMSGPHHYYGWIDPRQAHMIRRDERGNLTYVRVREPTGARKRRALSPDVLRVSNYEWMCGKSLSAEVRDLYAVKDELAVHLVDTEHGQADSLFDRPGILALGMAEVRLPLVPTPEEHNLAPFGAQVVRNDEAFSFDQELVARFTHAQHKLRVVTYNYGDEYLSDYLMRGSGVFIERHEFIQAITPMNEACGGYVVLGREVEGDTGGTELELIATTIPFGCTLLVNVGAIHGDSTLTGLYMMAMTGNHNAMKTADTVFMKDRHTRANVRVSTDPAAPVVAGLSGGRFLMTCDEKSLQELREDAQELKRAINGRVGFLKGLYWQPVLSTGTPAIGWSKTLGSQLPR